MTLEQRVAALEAWANGVRTAASVVMVQLPGTAKMDDLANLAIALAIDPPGGPGGPPLGPGN